METLSRWTVVEKKSTVSLSGDVSLGGKTLYLYVLYVLKKNALVQ